ncbi:hypothetical protein M440DRAFT_1325208 [Trichoderma longibrachiatum ATCC 18648]|uniref:Myb-like domain-containing protein n=1 Tax=Trichoderma longibrachiatum ATCC 18648 TaxID=983965 RepID=A0A2T4CF74_TRILO|nr:hypothetical protein M440DRAFT_1325208 [Trichoderma longibrachiatum ATCC 18648]
MQTRRSSKAGTAAPSSPPARPGLRRNPPRAKRPQENQNVGRDSSSDLSLLPTSPSTPSAILQKGSLPPSHASGGRPSTPTPVAPSDALPATPSVEVPRGLTTVPRKGSLVLVQPPRRGAPRRNSNSSLIISPGRDYSDDEPTIVPKTAEELHNEKMVLEDIEDAEHQLKIEASDSLARDASNVINQLRDKSRPAYQEVLSMKMQAFETSRRVFLGPGQAFPFLQYGWLDKTRLGISESKRATVRLAVKLANVATALSHIERIEPEARGSEAFLDALDAHFPHHFAAEEGRQYLSLSLDIRTQRAIERIVSSAQNIDKRTELSWVFCPTEPGAAQAPKGGYPELFQKGPYRPLAGLEAQTLVDVCSARVLRIWEIMSVNGTRGFRDPMNMAGVRKEFPFSDMLSHLKSWLLDRFQGITHLMAKMKDEEASKEQKRLLEQLRKEEDESRQALEQERKAGEQERRAKEQELRDREGASTREKRREQQDPDQGRMRRQRGAREDRAPGTRRQQNIREQARVRSEASAEEEMTSALSGTYPSPNADEGSWEGIGESSPESIRSSEPTPPRRISGNSRSFFNTRDLVSMLSARSLQEETTSESSRKRTRPSASDEPESGDDSEARPGLQKKSKTASSSTVVRRPRRSSQDDVDGSPVDETDEPSQDGHHDASQERQTRGQRHEPATSSAPAQLPRESQTQVDSPPQAPSSAPDYAAVRRAKEASRRTARRNKPRAPQTRHPWSERDCDTLIKLVKTRSASWAEIYNTDNGKFEHPRDAQAYRDKARNLKVDFLISDAPLPEGFDRVALSPKEVDRVRNAGKNPYRLEEDVDGYGRPTNTAYIP